MASLPFIEEHVPLGPLCTFRIGGRARYFARASRAPEVPLLAEAARERRVPLHILGGGSNTLCADGPIERFVIKMGESDIRASGETRGSLLLGAAAGTPWDELVAHAVARGVAGVEALSAIPGTVGAAPVQNVGAYGQEVGDTITGVRAYDVQERAFVDIPASECRFGYRTSIFKGGARGRFIITAVSFKLLGEPPRIPPFPDVERYFAEAGVPHPTVGDVRRAVIAIRARKLPDPAVIPSAGSFFKNPSVPREVREALRRKHPDIPAFTLPDGAWDIPAGWLIEQCGLRGTWRGNAGVYEKNAVVLVGNGKTTCREMLELRDLIIRRVRERFGIVLEMEPDVVG